MTLSLTILLTGFAVVFAVLLVLIGVIKLYGTIIYNLQNKKRNKKTIEKVETPKIAPPTSAPVAFSAEREDEEETDDALIAVIAAAVYTVCSPDKVRIRSIRRSSPRASAWRDAGLSEVTRPF